MEPSENVCLINVPMDLTKTQLKEKFFKELDLDQSKLHFPKAHFKKEWNTKLCFISFATINEARMAITIVNNSEYRGIIAKFGKTTMHLRKNSIGRSNGLDEIALNNDPVCNFCGAYEPKFICSGCCNMYTGTFYCSEEHQARDWFRHKSECKVMPPLKDASDHAAGKVIDEPLSELVEARLNIADNDDGLKKKFFIKPIDEHPVQGDKVYITCISSPRILFIRPVKEDVNYFKLFEDVKTTSINMAKKTEKPQVNDYILVPFKGSFHRAKILDFFGVDSEGYNTKVFMVDFGDVIKVKWQDCKELNYRLRGLRSYVFKFVLDGVQISDNEEILEYLEKIQGNNEALEIVEISQYGDRMILMRNNCEVINDKINDIAQRAATALRQTSTVAPILYNILRMKKIEPDHNVKLYLVDNSRLEKDKLITCMPHEKFSDYWKLISNIKAYSRNIPIENYEPIEINELVLARFKDFWHRAVVLDLKNSPNEIGITLIDSMIEIKTNSKTIRKIPISFAKEAFTQLCHVDEITDENIEIYKENLKRGPIDVAKILINSEDGLPVLKLDFVV